MQRTDKRRLIEVVRRHARDTGSASVQFALLTEKLRRLGGHLAKNRKDTSARSTLADLARRRRLVATWLEGNAPEAFHTITQRLRGGDQVVERMPRPVTRSAVVPRLPVDVPADSNLPPDPASPLHSGIICRLEAHFGFIRRITDGHPFYFTRRNDQFTLGLTVRFHVAGTERPTARSVHACRFNAGEQLALSAREQTGTLAWVHQQRGHGAVRVDGLEHSVHFTPGHLFENPGPRHIRLRFYVWDTDRGPVAECIRIDRPSRELMQKYTESELFAVLEKAKQLELLQPNFYFRNGSLMKSALLTDIERLWSLGFINRHNATRIVGWGPKKRIYIRHLRRLIEQSDARLSAALKAYFADLFVVAPLPLLRWFSSDPELFTGEVILRLLQQYVLPAGETRRRAEAARSVFRTLPRYFLRLRRLGTPLRPDALEWIFDQVCSSRERPRQSAVNGVLNELVALAEHDPQLAGTLLRFIGAFSSLRELGIVASELAAISVRCSERRVVIRLPQLATLVGRNFEFLFGRGLLGEYLRWLEDFRGRVQRSKVARLYLYDLELCFGDQVAAGLSRLAKTAHFRLQRPAKAPIERVTGIAVRTTPDVGRLRQALDLLTNPAFSDRIAEASLPPSLTELFPVTAEDLTTVRQWLAAAGLPLPSVKVGSTLVSAEELVEAGQLISDALLTTDLLESGGYHAMEAIGATLHGLVLEATQAFAFDNLRVERHTLPSADAHHGIAACIFNNRRFMADGVDMSLDRDVMMLFVNAYSADRLVRELACIVAIVCRDKKNEDLYLVVDGVAANDPLLLRVPGWEEPAVHALAKTARSLGAKLALTPKLKYGGVAERALLHFFGRDAALPSCKMFLLKRFTIPTPRYNNIWGRAGERSPLIGGTRILLVPASAEPGSPAAAPRDAPPSNSA